MGDDRLELAPLLWKRREVLVLDARALPGEQQWLACASVDDVVRAIGKRHVTGATAVGCAAAYGVAIAAWRAADVPGATAATLRDALDVAAERLAAAAGEAAAVPVFWALAQVRDAARVAASTADPHRVADAVEARAQAIQREDAARNRRMGDAAAALLPDGATVLTVGYHGAMASGGWGTALGAIRSATAAGRRLRVLVCEGRPSLDGARLAAWELDRAGVAVALLPDAAAAGVVARGEVGAVLLGAHRVSEGGEVVTDLGALGAALAAATTGAPVVVVTPAARIEAHPDLHPGVQPAEVAGAAWPALPDRVVRRWPAGDVLPASLVTALVTEDGVHRAPWSSLRRPG